MASTRKAKAKQAGSSSNSRRTQSTRSRQSKAQARTEKAEKIKKHNTTRFSNRPGRTRENEEDNSAQREVLALEKTLRVLGFGDTEVTLFKRQVQGNQLPDLPSLTFAQLASLATDPDLESKSEMLSKALRKLETQLSDLANHITSLDISDVFELFWMIIGVKPFDPTTIDTSLTRI